MSNSENESSPSYTIVAKIFNDTTATTLKKLMSLNWKLSIAKISF